MNNLIRVVMEGGTPQMVRFQAGMSAGGALALAGGSLGASDALAVDGRRATADTPVRPGATVTRQPKAENG